MTSRLHPGLSAAEYVHQRVGPLRLGKADITVLLTETNWSNRQIAAVAGVSHPTVAAVARSPGKDLPVDRPATTLGADGRYRPAHVVRTVQATAIEEVPLETVIRTEMR